MSFVVLSSLLLLVATCCSGSAVSVAPRIINGITAKPAKYLYQAVFQVGTTVLCGGSVLNTRWVLTAAFCFDGATIANVLVRVGTGGLLTGGTTYTIASFTPHPLYNAVTRIYDVAVVKTSIPMVYGTTILPVVLSVTSVITGAVPVVTGWGLSNSLLAPVTPTNLNVVNETVITNADCTTALVNSPTTTVTTTHMCAKNLLAAACTGDEGDPLTLYNMQFGILSYPSCVAGTPDVYTKVSTVYNWIKNESPESVG